MSRARRPARVESSKFELVPSNETEQTLIAHSKYTHPDGSITLDLALYFRDEAGVNWEWFGRLRMEKETSAGSKDPPTETP